MEFRQKGMLVRFPSRSMAALVGVRQTRGDRRASSSKFEDCSQNTERAHARKEKRPCQETDVTPWYDSYVNESTNVALGITSLKCASQNHHHHVHSWPPTVVPFDCCVPAVWSPYRQPQSLPHRLPSIRWNGASLERDFARPTNRHPSVTFE